MKNNKIMKTMMFAFAMLFAFQTAFAHCDTPEGPVIGAAITALETGNINYVLVWTKAEYDAEIKTAFLKTLEVRELGGKAQELADQYFFDTFVRIHRNGEGAPFTGIKPSGSHIDPTILAADKAVETGSLAPLEQYITSKNRDELLERFVEVKATKNYDINDVEGGREFIEAYVMFIHTLEISEGEGHEHGENSHHEIIIFTIIGVLSSLVLILGTLVLKKPKQNNKNKKNK